MALKVMKGHFLKNIVKRFVLFYHLLYNNLYLLSYMDNVCPCFTIMLIEEKKILKIIYNIFNIVSYLF